MKPKKLYSISWLADSINDLLEQLIRNCPDNHRLGFVGLKKAMFLKVVVKDIFIWDQNN
jgi:hypothetical protein